MWGVSPFIFIIPIGFGVLSMFHIGGCIVFGRFFSRKPSGAFVLSKRFNAWLFGCAVLTAILMDVISVSQSLKRNAARDAKFAAHQAKSASEEASMKTAIQSMIMPELDRIRTAINEGKELDEAHELESVQQVIQTLSSDAWKYPDVYGIDQKGAKEWWVLREYLKSTEMDSPEVQLATMKLIKAYLDRLETSESTLDQWNRNDLAWRIRFWMQNGLDHYLFKYEQDARFPTPVRQLAFQIMLEGGAFEQGGHSVTDSVFAEPMLRFVSTPKCWTEQGHRTTLSLCLRDLRQWPDATRPYLGELASIFYEQIRVGDDAALMQDLLLTILTTGGTDAIDENQLRPHNGDDETTQSRLRDWMRTAKREKAKLGRGPNR